MTDYKAEAERLSQSFDAGGWDNHIALFAEALKAAERRGRIAELENVAREMAGMANASLRAGEDFREWCRWADMQKRYREMAEGLKNRA